MLVYLQVMTKILDIVLMTDAQCEHSFITYHIFANSLSNFKVTIFTLLHVTHNKICNELSHFYYNIIALDMFNILLRQLLDATTVLYFLLNCTV